MFWRYCCKHPPSTNIRSHLYLWLPQTQSICKHLYLWPSGNRNISNSHKCRCFVARYRCFADFRSHRRKTAYSRVCGLLRSQDALELHLWLRNSPNISAIFCCIYLPPTNTATICFRDHPRTQSIRKHLYLWLSAARNIRFYLYLRTCGPQNILTICIALYISVSNSNSWLSEHHISL